MEDILLVIIVTAIISLLINVYIKKYDMPPIIGYIFSGTIIASFLHISHSKEHILAELSEIGIVFLMFTIGLEMRLENLKNLKKQVFTYGSLQVGLSMSLFTLIAHFIFKFELKSSLAIGAALAMSSTAIVLKILNDSGNISKKYGQNTLGILIFQDLAVIPILLMITMMTNENSSLSSMLIKTIISAGALIGIMLLVGKYLLDPALKWVSKTNQHELFILAILVITLGASYVAYLFDFTYSLGAFMGGMLIAETHYKHQVEADLVPFRDIFLAIFFVTVGMQINVNFLVPNIAFIMLLAIGIIMVKITIIYLIVNRFTDKSTSFKTALVISQVGEFSFVIFTQATNFNLIDKNTGQLLSLAIITSMIATPFIIKNLDKIVNFIFKKVQKEVVENTHAKKLKNHAIVCGYGGFGKLIVENLKLHEIPHTIIIDNYDLFEQAIKNKENVIFGNPALRSILLEAGIKEAKVVLIGVHAPDQIELISHAISSITKDVKIIAKVNNKRILRMMASDGIDITHFVDMYEFASLQMSLQVIQDIKNQQDSL